MLKHALNCVQHLRLQPVMLAEGSSVIAVQMLPQERKSSLQTRTLWLLAEHGDIGARSDWKGGASSAAGGRKSCRATGPYRALIYLLGLQASDLEREQGRKDQKGQISS